MTEKMGFQIKLKLTLWMLVSDTDCRSFSGQIYVFHYAKHVPVQTEKKAYFRYTYTSL